MDRLAGVSKAAINFSRELTLLALYMGCVVGASMARAQEPELTWMTPQTRIPFSSYQAACEYSLSGYCARATGSGCVSVILETITYYPGGGRPFASCGGTGTFVYTDSQGEHTRTIKSSSWDAAYSSPVRYVLVDPVDAPPPQQCAGNPIDVSLGAKLQREVDISSSDEGQIELMRFYQAAQHGQSAQWAHNYQHSLTVVDSIRTQAIRYKSPLYSTKSEACALGWTNIRSGISDTWASNATASLNGDLCQIRKNNKVTRNLIVMKDVFVDQSMVAPVIKLTRANGAVMAYQRVGDRWVSINGSGGMLEQISLGNSRWRYLYNGVVEEYSEEGKLLSVIAKSGMKQELLYDQASGLLTRVRDAAGGVLIFAYTNSALTGVSNNNQVTSYSYDASGLLTQVTRPDNSARIYHYEDSRFPSYLTGITDECGVRYATWTYDDQGRAISSEHAGGTDKTLLAFNADGSTTVTNALGKQTTYRFDDIAGARRVMQVEGYATTSCEGANQHYTYTPEGWLASKTDWKGTTTTYSYNPFGQEISRTEAFGTPEARTITTEWHPDFYVKTRVVEGGKETLYTYDDNGRLLSTTTNSLQIQ